MLRRLATVAPRIPSDSTQYPSRSGLTAETPSPPRALAPSRPREAFPPTVTSERPNARTPERLSLFTRPPLSGLACLVLGAGALAPALPAPASWGAQSTQAGVVRVHAGDTLLVETAEGVQITLRLLGVQAPSLREVRPPNGRKAVGQPFSEEAKRALEDLVLKRKVRVEFYGRDALRQPLAVVFLGDENVNVHMVRGGLARVDREAPRMPEGLREALEKAEAEARRERRGLWMFE